MLSLRACKYIFIHSKLWKNTPFVLQYIVQSIFVYGNNAINACHYIKFLYGNCCYKSVMQSYNTSDDTLHRDRSCWIWRIYNDLPCHISFDLKYFFIRVALKIYIISFQLFISYILVWIFNAAANLQIEYHGSEINGKWKRRYKEINGCMYFLRVKCE